MEQETEKTLRHECRSLQTEKGSGEEKEPSERILCVEVEYLVMQGMEEKLHSKHNVVLYTFEELHRERILASNQQFRAKFAGKGAQDNLKFPSTYIKKPDHVRVLFVK